MNLTDKMAYLRGMVDGMELDLTTSKEGKVLGQLLDVMQEMTAYVVDLQTQVDELTEVCDLLDQDLGDVEDVVYDEEDDDDAFAPYDDEEELEEDDEDLYEAVCPSCNNVIALSESILEEGEMPCPCCGEMLEFDYSDLMTETQTWLRTALRKKHNPAHIGNNSREQHRNMQQCTVFPDSFCKKRQAGGKSACFIPMTALSETKICVYP